MRSATQLARGLVQPFALGLAIVGRGVVGPFQQRLQRLLGQRPLLPGDSTASRNARPPRRPGNTRPASRIRTSAFSWFPSPSSARAYSRWPSGDLKSGILADQFVERVARRGRVTRGELRVRIAQQQLGIVGENSCQTILIDSQGFGGATQSHQLVGILLARRHVAADLHGVLGAPQVALGVERRADAAHRALAGRVSAAGRAGLPRRGTPASRRTGRT